MIRTLNTQVEAIHADNNGVSAIEFALFAGLLVFGLLNTADVSIYLYKRMQVANAAEMGAQAAWQACDPPNYLPATTNCTVPNHDLMTAVQNGIQSTSLGAQVSLQTGYPAEGYYCVNSSNALQYVSGVSSKPADCSAVGTPNLQPGDYIKIETAFAYQPLFPGISVASAFATPITESALMRLD